MIKKFPIATVAHTSQTNEKIPVQKQQNQSAPVYMVKLWTTIVITKIISRNEQLMEAPLKASSDNLGSPEDFLSSFSISVKFR